MKNVVTHRLKDELSACQGVSYAPARGLRLTLFVLTALLPGACAAAPPDDGVEDLIGTRWVAEDIDGDEVVDQPQSTISFDEATRVTGNAGCNRFFGSAQLGAQTLELGPLGSTRMACPDAIMDQEYRFLKALEASRRYRLDAGTNRLSLSDAQGNIVLRFSRLED